MANTRNLIAHYESLTPSTPAKAPNFGLTSVNPIRPKNQQMMPRSDDDARQDEKVDARTAHTRLHNLLLPNGESTTFSSALENQVMLKKSFTSAMPFHTNNRRRMAIRRNRERWRQSIAVWQEQATKCQESALTQCFVKHIG